MTTWKDIVIDALNHHNGKAHLSDIYKYVNLNINNLSKSYKATIRATLERNSPDSVTFIEGTKPLFKSSEGLGKGILELFSFDTYIEDYDTNEFKIINKDINNSINLDFINKKEKKDIIINKAGFKTQKRSIKKALNALNHANYKCETNCENKLFIRKNSNINYTEPHHLIPISKHEDYDYSLDVEINIVSLCSYCHNLLHYGRIEDKRAILKNLFNDRINGLRECGLNLSFAELESYYI